MKMRDLPLIGALVGVSVATWFTLSYVKDHFHKAPEEAPAISVNDHGVVRIPEQSPLRARLAVQTTIPTETAYKMSTPGQVEANPALTVNVLPPLTGRIIGLKVQLGDQVRKGQLLATIASGDMAQAYSDLVKARDTLDLARKARNRTRDVGQIGAAAAKDIEAADSGVRQAEAELARSQIRLDSYAASEAVGKAAGPVLNLTAPSNGVVTALNVGDGGFVDDPTAPMMTITNISTVYVTAYLPENQIGAVKKGQDAEITLPAYADEILHGKVASVSNVMDPVSRRLGVRLIFENTLDHLIPNMYASVSFAVAQPPQLILPQSALLMNNDRTTVFVEVEPWAFARRTVEIGYDEGDQVRVLSGLKNGERVLVKGGVLIND